MLAQSVGGPNSDIDVLEEYEPGIRVELGFLALERELSAPIMRKVELNLQASSAAVSETSWWSPSRDHRPKISSKT